MSDDQQLFAALCRFLERDLFLSIFFFFSSVAGDKRGLVVRALDLESGGPGFKSFSLPLDGFVFGGPEFNSATLCT